MKQLFKPKEGEQDDGIKLKKKNVGDKADNIKIKREGKDPLNDSEDKKSVVSLNIIDIDRIVFKGATKRDLDRQRLAYREEESYLNPSTEESRVEYEQVESFIQHNTAEES